MVYTARQKIPTKGQGDAHDVTAVVSKAIAAAQQRAGVATVFVVGSTAAITTIEFEPGAIADLNRLLETLAPRRGQYEHHLRWGDDNGSSHARAALIGPSVTIPFADGACCWNVIPARERGKSSCRSWAASGSSPRAATSTGTW
jgi:secondary thiamine-phosphate synthase enzyme